MNKLWDRRKTGSIIAYMKVKKTAPVTSVTGAVE